MEMKNKEKYNQIQFNLVALDDPTTIIGQLKCGLMHAEIECDGKIVKEYVCTNEIGFKKFLAWLEEEYDPKILTDKEKAYLSAVIKPFRKDIEYIEKFKSNYVGKEYIYIVMKKDDDYCKLPRFFKGTMYKGMEVGKKYGLEELGI